MIPWLRFLAGGSCKRSHSSLIPHGAEISNSGTVALTNFACPRLYAAFAIVAGDSAPMVRLGGRSAHDTIKKT